MKALVTFSLAMLVSLIGLLTLWCTAAQAADVSFEVEVVTAQPPARMLAMRCYRQPLANGRVGESVQVCDTVAPKVRVGVTRVEHVRR